MKICQQCGRQLVDSQFRSYYPRGNKKAPKVGSNTICVTCEALNAKVNRLWKIEEDCRSAEQQRLLDDAALFYKELANRGLSPKGKYAAYVLGQDSGQSMDEVFKDLFKTVLTPEVVPEYMEEYSRLLTMDLTEEPDVYHDMLDELLSKTCGPGGKALSEYKDVYNQTLERFDDYEDNYEWE